MNKNYLTPEGFDRIRSELQMLMKTERPKVVQAVSDAAAMGDRSENAEYIYGKKRLREIDSRIRFLTKRLDNVEVIDPSVVSVEKVSFRVWVSIEDEDGTLVSYQIVGEDEIDPKNHRITFSSPLGRALLGKRVGDSFEFQRPAGPQELEIVSIENSRPSHLKK